MTLPISVIVLTFNEERNIGPCLDSLRAWAGEIFVVDSGSTDQTLDIARQTTDKIVSHPFENYAKQRNWAQANLPLSYEWVFHVDADERVTPGLAAALKTFFEHLPDDVDGLLVRRRIEFLGRHMRYGGIYPTYHCRIFKRSKGCCEDREYDQHYLVDGKTDRLEADLTEVTATTLPSWTARHNRWAQMEANHYYQLDQQVETAKNGKNRVEGKLGGTVIEQRRYMRASVYGKAPIFLRAFVYFVARYLLLGGFLDGTPGLIYHTLHGFWFRFYTDAVLYEMRLEQSG